MSESADGDGSRGGPSDDPSAEHDDGDAAVSGVPIESTVPPTRRQPSAGLPDAASPIGAAGDPVDFPDDSRLARWLRSADRVLGHAEQAALFGLLGAVVLTAAAAALSERVLGVPLGRWWFDIVRGGTFSVAMLGAVFATHQRRHLAMDLVSRRLAPRSRLILRIVLALFTIFIAMLLRRSGMHQLDTVGQESGDHLVSTRTIVWFLPAGATLIALHMLLHMVIDIDYLVRGKTPPERMRSGH